MGLLLPSIYTERFQVTAVLCLAATSFNSYPGTSVGVVALVQRWLRGLDSDQGLEVVATTLRAEWGDVATPIRH